MNKKFVALALAGLTLTGCSGIPVTMTMTYGVGNNNKISLEYVTDSSIKSGKLDMEGYTGFTLIDADDDTKVLEVMLTEPENTYGAETGKFNGYDAYKVVDGDECKVVVDVFDDAWVTLHSDSMDEDEFDNMVKKITISSQHGK